MPSTIVLPEINDEYPCPLLMQESIIWMSIHLAITNRFIKLNPSLLIFKIYTPGMISFTEILTWLYPFVILTGYCLTN